MKAGFWVSTVVALVLAVLVVVAMGKISDLESEVAALKEEQPAKSAVSVQPSNPRPVGRVLPIRSEAPAKSARAVVQNEPSKDPDAEEGTGTAEKSPEEMIGELMRAFVQSEAGKKMQAAENLKRGKRVFKPLLEEFNFSEEEEEHFLSIAGAEAGSQDDLWGKLMFSKPEDREALMQEWEDAKAQRQRDMEGFLNSDDDWKRYQDYQVRLPEYEQLNGIREEMQTAGVPMDTAHESQLVEIMHSNRIESGISERWEGRGVMTQISQPGIVQRLETDWKAGQGELEAGVGEVLSAKQVEVFNGAQQEMLEGITEGLGMIETTFKAGGGSAPAPSETEAE